MVKLSFYPKIILDIIANMPTIAFKCVDMKQFFSTSKQVFTQYSKKQLNPAALNNAKSCNISGLQIVDQPQQFTGITELDPVCGERILAIYFSQLKSAGPIFIDLRRNHFKAEGSETIWLPNNLIYHFKSDFREALMELYKGFYYNNLEQFDQAMSKLGMTQGLDQSEIEKLRNLFWKHFGDDSEALKFDLDRFNQSFQDIFDFFVSHQIRIDIDFIFLGAYLGTFYMHMQNYSAAFNVRKIFLQIFPLEAN
jgi:predicted unusual protein kinase regulating ubiquinone biosynthesis (AarF/ABC1/UbiB family)